MKITKKLSHLSPEFPCDKIDLKEENKEQREEKDKYVEYSIEQILGGILGRPDSLATGRSCLLVRTSQAADRQWGSISSAIDALSSCNKIIILKFTDTNDIKD